MKLLKTFRVYFFIISISLLIVEFVFRDIYHVIPGIGVSHLTFEKVDHLKLLKGFIADSNGITKADTFAAHEAEEIIAAKGISSLWADDDFESQFKKMYGDAAFIYARESKFNFAVYCQNIVQNSPISDLDSAILYYTKHPINDDGFRSIAFKNYHTDRKKVLLLGDSFTWGQELPVLYNCFADYLLSKGLIVYNTGIPGTDPAQYYAIAKKYIAILHPDYVIANICLANDVFNYKRELKPYLPVEYCTNAYGGLYSCPDGYHYFTTAQATYDNLLEQACIPAKKGVPYPFYTHTAIGTILWQFLHKIGVVGAVNRPAVIPLEPLNHPSCNDDLKEIKAIADSNNCKLIIIAIPAYTDTGLTQVSNYPNLFTGMEYYTPHVTPQDYETTSRHYNQSGHKKHGDFILKLIGQD